MADLIGALIAILVWVLILPFILLAILLGNTCCFCSSRISQFA